MEKTRPETIKQYLRELGESIRKSIRIDIAGGASLILGGYISRRTTDVDIINEVPAELRSQHALLDELKTRYGLELGHVQSHYFPSGWDQRVHSIESLGWLQIYLVDVYDVLLSKLFSARDKDRDDLRFILPNLEKDVFVRRLKETCAGFLVAPRLRELAEKNWYILYGEALPS